jgi:signal peptidase I
MNKFINEVWKNNKSILVFLSLMLVFRSAVADWSDVPTGSMKPTIVEGDRIFVNKMAYDIRLPFSHISLVKLADPKHNDVIIFDSKVSNKRLVKRVIGEPGDVVSMSSNRLTINGEPLKYTTVKQAEKYSHQIESLGNVAHQVTITSPNSRLASFSEVTVPQGYYLVLGDNRDNSADSRVIGFVPRDEIVGRSTHVVLSVDYDNYLVPRHERFWHEL